MHNAKKVASPTIDLKGASIKKLKISTEVKSDKKDKTGKAPPGRK